ncbi:MAG: pyrroline-5-carboxylate reductase [Eubacteriales bacterium]|jgi:pyrroline-5-carboxylate reductase
MKLGMIGAGNMGKAILGGILSSGRAVAGDVLVSNRTQPALDMMREEFGLDGTRDNCQVAQWAQVLFLAVKPQMYEAVIAQIAPVVREDAVVVTMAPGWTLDRLEQAFGRPVKLVRTMPNTPAMVSEGMTAVCANDRVTPEELEGVCRLLEGCGRCAVIGESMMDAVVAVSGSSPAYVYLFIEALADGAVREGMPRAMAYQFAAQAVLGSAKMVLETGRHPGELKDMVCSPAGTTIEAVRVLEQKGFRSSVLEAMKACADKCRGM